MSKVFILGLLGSVLAIPAATQTGQPSGASSANPLSTWLRNAYMGNRNIIVRSAEKMPEENYGMRPGTQQEVRTFGQQVGHVANYNFLWCSQAKGEKNPNAGNNLEKLNTKAEFLKALNDAFAYCDGVYSSLTDASGTEMIDITQESGRQTRNLRMALLILNFAHNNEIYGNIVTYMRMKDIVPSSSEPRPQPQQPH
ncbi:MAG: DinB family protein [Acidobacteria bacterium]|nr:MAG: DinB family protein [Acidobacteriota bacterium]